MDDSNRPTLEDLKVIGEMQPTPLRTRVHPTGGHPSDPSSDEHMRSRMLRLTYSNPQASGAFRTYVSAPNYATVPCERAAD